MTICFQSWAIGPGASEQLLFEKVCSLCCLVIVDLFDYVDVRYYKLR